MTVSISSSTASAVYQRDPGRLNVAKELGGSQPALKKKKKGLFFRHHLYWSFLHSAKICGASITYRKMVSVLEEPVRGRMKEGVGKDSRGTLIKTQEEKFRSRKV